MWLSQKEANSIERKIFSTSIKSVKSWGKDLIWRKRDFLFTPWNGPIIKENSFSAQNEPHTAKPSLSGVLKHFCGNWQNNNMDL